MTGRSLLLFALEPDGGTPIALRQAARALRRLTEAPPTVPAGRRRRRRSAGGGAASASSGRSADR